MNKRKRKGTEKPFDVDPQTAAAVQSYFNVVKSESVIHQFIRDRMRQLEQLGMKDALACIDAYFGHRVTQSELQEYTSKAFDSGQVVSSIVPLIQLIRNGEYRLLLLNPTRKTHLVSAGDSLTDLYCITACEQLQCVDGRLNVSITHCHVELVGPKTIVPPKKFIAVPIDLNFISRQQLDHERFEITVCLKVDDECYCNFAGHIRSESEMVL